MPYISQSSIQELSDRLDALAVISDYVHLDKRGGRFWARCPFHQEKTASFTVNPELKTYYCFGCHKGGTAINFVMEMDKLSFPEAIELLAKRFSVDLVYEDSTGNFSGEDDAKKKAKEELLELYSRMTGTFHHFLLKKREYEDIKHYILSRGINIEMLERFGLGYAPPDRFWLHKFLLGKGYSREFLASSGLFSSKNPDLSLFSGRLMFPICNRQGKVVAFSGRIMNEEKSQSDGWKPPKYINSPELGIYKKGETLYGIDLAMPEIRRTKTAYITEGNFDVIALHQAGITNAVAPLGTAFTEEQAKLLKRWAERIVFFFDPDEAGQAAMLKGILTCRKNGLACGIVDLQKLKDDTNKQLLSIFSNRPASSEDLPDPAAILKLLGPEALHKIAKSFINDFDYLINRASSIYFSEGKASAKASEKAAALAFLFPYIELQESEVERSSYIETAADALGLLPSAAADDYRHYAQRNSAKTERTIKSGGKTENVIRMNDELSLLIALALDYVSSIKEKLFIKFRSVLSVSEIKDPGAKEVFIALEECIRYGEISIDDFLMRIHTPGLREFIVERSSTGEFSVNAEQLVEDGIKKIRGKSLEQRQAEIIVELRSIKNKAMKEEPEETELIIQELLSEKMKIDRELLQLTQGR